MAELDIAKLAADSIVKDSRMIRSEQVMTLAAGLPEKLL